MGRRPRAARRRPAARCASAWRRELPVGGRREPPLGGFGSRRTRVRASRAGRRRHPRASDRVVRREDVQGNGIQPSSRPARDARLDGPDDGLRPGRRADHALPRLQPVQSRVELLRRMVRRVRLAAGLGIVVRGAGQLVGSRRSPGRGATVIARSRDRGDDAGAVRAPRRVAGCRQGGGHRARAVAQPWTRVIGGHAAVAELAFTPDSKWLLSCAMDGAHRWPLDPSAGEAGLLAELGGGPNCYSIAVSPDGREVLRGFGGAKVVSLLGQRGRWLSPRGGPPTRRSVRLHSIPLAG